jgi:hypothetical protein
MARLSQIRINLADWLQTIANFIDDTAARRARDEAAALFWYNLNPKDVKKLYPELNRAGQNLHGKSDLEKELRINEQLFGWEVEFLNMRYGSTL